MDEREAHFSWAGQPGHFVFLSLGLSSHIIPYALNPKRLTLAPLSPQTLNPQPSSMRRLKQTLLTDITKPHKAAAL